MSIRRLGENVLQQREIDAEVEQERCEVEMSKEKQWEGCGYISISKSGKVLSVVVKHQRYVANLEELNQVLEGIREYTLIFEHKKAC